ncbi:CsgG/HfaB family protein [bacterium]|nr:CsgG/HfaB family protein [bacterium]
MKRPAWLLSLLTILLVSSSWGWERPVVAVLPLDAVGVEENAVVGITEALRDSLIDSGRYTVVERSQLATVLEEQAAIPSRPLRLVAWSEPKRLFSVQSVGLASFIN